MTIFLVLVVSFVDGRTTERSVPITEDYLHPTSLSTIEKDSSDVTELLSSHKPTLDHQQHPLLSSAVVGTSSHHTTKNPHETTLDHHQYPLPPSAVVVTSSHYTTNNPLDNLKDFTTWVPVDVHDFYLSSENNVEGNEFGLIDQLALESEQNPATVITFTLEKDIGHADLHGDSQSKEKHENSVPVTTEVSTSTSYSVSSTSQVWVTDEDFILSSQSTTNYHEDTDDTTISVTAENIEEEEDDIEENVLPVVSTTTMSDSTKHTITGTASFVDAQTSVGVTETISQAHTTVSLENSPDIFSEETDIVFKQTNSDDHHEFILAKLRPKDDYFELYEENKGNRQSGELNDEILEEERKEMKSFNSDLYEVVTASSVFSDVPSESTPENKKSSSSDPANIDDFEVKYENLLNNLKEKYGFPSSNIEDEYLPEDPSHEAPEKHREHPLITLTRIEPHAMMLLVKPQVFHPGTMVRLMYERVPRKKSPLLQHLDDPVIEYLPLYRPVQEHELSELPMGKYIVCGEAQLHGQVQQANCFETLIDRHDTNSLQSGVVGIIVVALLIVFSVLLYVIYHKLMGVKKERKLQDKLNMVVKKKKVDELSSSQESSESYPELSEEFEERYIM